MNPIVIMIRNRYIFRKSSGLKFNFARYFSNENDLADTVSENMVHINWRRKDGTVTATNAKEGTVLLRSAQANGIELEGACEGVILRTIFWYLALLILSIYLTPGLCLFYLPCNFRCRIV